MSYQGDIRTSQVLYFHFTTRQFSTGAPITAASLALSVYKDDNTTESTTGVTTTYTTGFDGRVGLVSVKIDTSADGSFYAAGHDFSVVVTGGTADSVSIVSEVVGGFSIENRSALMPTTAARKLDVSAGGEAGVDWANVGSPTTSLALTGTTIATTQKVDVETIKTNPVVNGGTITFPTTATLASTTNITAGTITTATTATNLTNAPTNGDFTAVMKTSIGTAVAASAVASVTAPVTVGTNNDKTGYTLTTAGYASAADKLLGRNLAGGSDGTRTVQDALRLLRNKASVAAGTLTVTQEDDATPAWTAAVVTTSGNPISSIDPA